MKLARFEAGGAAQVGAVRTDGVVPLAPLGVSSMIELIAAGGEVLDEVRAYVASAKSTLALTTVRLLAPVEAPGKYLAIGMNYERHALEAERMGVARQDSQLWFNKQTSCIAGPFDAVRRGNTLQLDYEVELGVVVGQAARNVVPGEAHRHVFGYLVANDVSARDWQFRSPTFILGKGFDTHGPIGPWIVTADAVPAPHSLGLRCFVNGEKRQDSNTADMISDIWSQIAHLSAAFTLHPGDLLSTGTPEGVGAAADPSRFLQDGDIVRCEIDGIGAIENRITP